MACTLSPRAFDERVAWIADLNRTLVRHAQRDLTLALHYPVAEGFRVRELVRRERACCGFLDFDVAESATGVVLRITAPAETRDVLEDIFAPFLPATDAPAGDRLSANRLAPTAQALNCALSASTTCGTDPLAPCGCGPSWATAPRTTTPPTALADVDASGEADPSGLGRASRAGAMTTTGLAVACGVCCVLPFALPAVALTAFGGIVATVASAYRWAVVVAVGAVVTAWAWVLWQSVRSRRAPTRSTRRAMSVATMLLVVALAWRILERSFMAWLRGR